MDCPHANWRVRMAETSGHHTEDGMETALAGVILVVFVGGFLAILSKMGALH